MQLKSILLALAMLTAPAAWAQAAQMTVHDVQLDSGITLADWLSLPAQQAKEPSLEAGAQAAVYVNRYGPFRELLDVVNRTAGARRFDSRNVSANNADQLLADVDAARKLLGSWPALLLTRAKALALRQDYGAARRALMDWLAAAPSSMTNRQEIAALLVNSQQDTDPIRKWSQRAGGNAYSRVEMLKEWPSAIPEASARAVAACTGEFPVPARVLFESIDGKRTDNWQVPLYPLGFQNFGDAYSIQQIKYEYYFSSTIFQNFSSKFTNSESVNYGTFITKNIDCDGQFFPIVSNKRFNVRFLTEMRSKFEFKNRLQDGLALIQNENTYSVESEYDSDAFEERFRDIRINDVNRKWLRFFDIKLSTTQTHFDNYDGYNKRAGRPGDPISVEMIYIDGLHIFISPQYFKGSITPQY